MGSEISITLKEIKTRLNLSYQRVIQKQVQLERSMPLVRIFYYLELMNI